MMDMIGMTTPYNILSHGDVDARSSRRGSRRTTSTRARWACGRRGGIERLDATSVRVGERCDFRGRRGRKALDERLDRPNDAPIEEAATGEGFYKYV